MVANKANDHQCALASESTPDGCVVVNEELFVAIKGNDENPLF